MQQKLRERLGGHRATSEIAQNIPFAPLASEERIMPTSFVLMPFSDEFNEIYSRFISRALTEAGYEVRRADDVASNQSILKDIVQSIVSSDLIVADLTSPNANVYYELGLAHAFGKPVILLTQDISGLPFDLKSYRVITYDTHFIQMSRAHEQLARIAKEALAGNMAFGSPISDFLGIPVQCIAIKGTRRREDGEDNVGFIDHLIQVQEGSQQLAKLMDAVAHETHNMTELTVSFATQFKTLGDASGLNSVMEMRNLIRSYSAKMNTYSEFLSRSNDEYRQVLALLGESLEPVISFQTPDNEQSVATLKASIQGLKTLEKSARDGKKAFKGTAEIVKGLPNIERSFMSARDSVSRQLAILVDNIDQTASLATRAITKADMLLENG